MNQVFGGAGAGRSAKIADKLVNMAKNSRLRGGWARNRSARRLSIAA